MADLPVVYGGPYAHETDAIRREINVAKEMDRKPNFDEVVKDWTEISQGAIEYLKVNGEPEIIDGPSQLFQNVLFEVEPEPVYVVEKVVGDIEMPPPLAGFSPVITFKEEPPVVDETDFVAPAEPIIVEEPASETPAETTPVEETPV